MKTTKNKPAACPSFPAPIFILLTLFLLSSPLSLKAQTINFIVLKKDNLTIRRTGTFVQSLIEPSKKSIDPRDPGAKAHLTLLTKDNCLIQGSNDSLEKLLHNAGSFVYSFENTDMLDSTIYLPLIKDSTTVERFMDRVKLVRKHEWVLYRIVIRPRSHNRNTGVSYAMYVRYQDDLLTVNLPNKSNRENLRMRSISPSIPLIHLGGYDSSQYNVGPGIAFNIGLAPRRPLLRLGADFLGPISIEWMIHPINNVDDLLAVHGTALGVFFNSGYGIFHWGFAFYTLKYSRAEAYIGINFVPVIQLWNSRGKQRYKW